MSADYFTTMQIPLAGGQVFTAEDGPQGQPVVVVNQAMANPLLVQPGPNREANQDWHPDSKSPWFMVKGVVEDSAQSALNPTLHA